VAVLTRTRENIVAGRIGGPPPMEEQRVGWRAVLRGWFGG